MNFVIRDDDLNYFSQPSDIERWYSDIFSQRIPVGFSAVPFVKPLSDVYPHDIPPEDKEYPISNNKKLVDYIKSNPLMEIMQHGCTHQTKNGVFEYLKKESLTEDTQRGKEELEKAFAREIRVFVPPHDQISNQGIEAVEKCRMNIIRGKGMKNILLRKEGIMAILKMLNHKLENFKRNPLPAYPYIIDLATHQEAFSFRLKTDNLSELKEGLYYMKEKNGNFIITNHLHHFDNFRKKNLLELIKLGEKIKARFIFPKELFNY